MKIKWSHEALERLIEIEDYISKDSPARAIQFVDQLIEHAELLSDKPRIGRIVPELATPDIRELIFKKYRIVYRLQKNHLTILTVFEGHRMPRSAEFDVAPIKP
jgi:addiction module RelE/StbE family toxin